MKKYKVKEVLKLLTKDGWYLSAQKGSHRQYKHLTKGGKVTVMASRAIPWISN